MSIAQRVAGARVRNETSDTLMLEASRDVVLYGIASYVAWLENRVIEARSLAKTCYDHFVFPADSSEVAIDAQAKFEKWGMR